MMTTDEHRELLGDEAVERIEGAVYDVATNVRSTKATRALCELLIDMVATTLAEVAGQRRSFELREVLMDLIVQLHTITLRTADNDALAAVSIPAIRRWSIPPLVPQRLGARLTDKQAHWVADLVESVDDYVDGASLTVRIEVASRLLGSCLRSLQCSQKDVPIVFLLEDAVGRALETNEAWKLAERGAP